MVVGYAPSKHDSLEVQFFTQFLAVFVHASRQAQASIVRMYKHFNAIKDVAFRIMCVKGLVACYLCIGVVAFYQIIVDDDG